MPVALVDIRSCAGVPAEMVACGHPPIPSKTRHAVDERILIHTDIRAVEYHHAVVAVDKNISGANGTFRDFKKESVVARPG